MKRCLVLALALMLLNSAVAESWLVYYGNPEEGYTNPCLVSDSGVIAGADQYSSIMCLYPYEYTGAMQRYAVTRQSVFSPEEYSSLFEGDWLEEDPYDESSGPYLPQAMMDGSGNLLTGFDYEFLYEDYYPDLGLYIARSEAGMTVLRADGTVAIEGRYSDILPDGRDGFLAIRDERLIHIDANGTESDMGLDVQYLTDCSLENDCVYGCLCGEEGAYMLLDLQGRPRTEERFASVGGWAGSYAFVRTLDKTRNVIDMDGRHVFEEPMASIQQLGESSRFLCLRDGANGAEVLLLDAATGQTLLSRTLPGRAAGDVKVTPRGERRPARPGGPRL